MPSAVLPTLHSWLSDPVRLTAASTAFLALVTFGLVIATLFVSRQTRNAARAGHKPRLGDVPLGEYMQERTIRYGDNQTPVTLLDLGDMHIAATRDGYFQVIVQRSVGVRNVGSGAAVVQCVELDVEHPAHVEGVGAFPDPATIPAGGIARLLTVVNYGEADVELLDILSREVTNFSISAEYTDVAGEQRERITIRSRQHAGHGLAIEQDRTHPPEVRSVGRWELRRRRAKEQTWGRPDMPGIWP